MLVGGRKFARLLKLHLRLAAVDNPFTGLGAKDAAAAGGAGVALA